MKLAGSMFALFALATTCSAAIKTVSDSDFKDVFNNIKKSDKGFLHLADDGVLRSYDGEGDEANVIDYTAFSSAQIQSFIAGYTEDTAQRAHLDEVYANVGPIATYITSTTASGSAADADDTEMWKPSPANRPPAEGQEWNANATPATSDNENSPQKMGLAKQFFSWCRPRRCKFYGDCWTSGCDYCFGIDAEVKTCYKIVPDDTPYPPPAPPNSPWLHPVSPHHGKAD